jgi:hypothetical protein
VPADLDDLIFKYQQLPAVNRAKFDRAAFWMYQSFRQWTLSMSSSFAAVVSAVEALIGVPGPGATERFRVFLETYAPGESLIKRRSEMYNLRSDILHGSYLMRLDQDRDFKLDPPGWNEYDLNSELLGLAHLSLRNWLSNPPN